MEAVSLEMRDGRATDVEVEIMSKAYFQIETSDNGTASLRFIGNKPWAESKG
jgi:hypothetical protein